MSKTARRGVIAEALREHCGIAAEFACEDIIEALTAAGFIVRAKEPTDQMLDAGRALQSIGDEELSRDNMRAKWNAMIAVE